MKAKITPPKTVDEFIKRFSPLLHEVDDEKCWCNPDVVQQCRAKEFYDMTCSPDCWRCEGTGYEPRYNRKQSAEIIHKDV